MSALVLNAVYKSFGAVEVLKDINLRVDHNEFVVFVGPSGCGKSTLLRIIAGLEAVTSGAVEIDGRNVNDIPPAKRDIAMVFQSYALYPHLTVRGNMALGLKQAGHNKIEIQQRISEASRMLSLSDYLERRPAELSGGQRQRVAIGRSIVRNPKLFLFDEPLSNLDAALRQNTRIEIANLHRQINAGMVYVTHDQTEAMTLADRIVVLNNGVIEQVGSSMELYNDPINRFVAEFIGSPAMNFVPAEMIGGRSGIEFGIRPEHAYFGQHGVLAGVVVHVEMLGADTNTIVDIGIARSFTVRTAGQHSIDIGTEVKIEIDSSRLLEFDSMGQRV